jgi:hypothetical protein
LSDNCSSGFGGCPDVCRSGRTLFQEVREMGRFALATIISINHLAILAGLAEARFCVSSLLGQIVLK